MGKLRTIFHYISLGIIDSDKDIERKNCELKRKNTVCYFDERISFEDFKNIAVKVAKPIKRLYVSVDHHLVRGHVKTVSGIDSWEFELDFNDFGKITGSFWWSFCENMDSNIPDNYAKNLRLEIQDFISYKEKNVLNSNFKNGYSDQSGEFVCPNCEAILNNQAGFSSNLDFYTCKNCNQKIYSPQIYSGEKYANIYWYCDGCNALLNKQKGFNDKNGIWHCSECGYKNIIDKNNNI